MSADDLTTEEARAIASLQRLAKRWPQSLRLLSIDGGLCVIHAADSDAMSDRTTWDDRYVLADIDGIPNDGGGA